MAEQKRKKMSKPSKREGSTAITIDAVIRRGRIGRKMYGSQTVVAEERRRFILLSSQRAKLKSTILAAIKSATMMANTRMGIEDNSMREKGNSRERKENSKGWSNKYEEKK